MNNHWSLQEANDRLSIEPRRGEDAKVNSFDHVSLISDHCSYFLLHPSYVL